MPRLSVLMIRASLGYAAAGFLIGSIMLADRGYPLGSWVYLLRPAHIEFLLLGWMAQFALGVAFWILPRFRSGAERGRTSLAWAAFALLNAGILAVAIGGAAGISANTGPGVTAIGGTVGISVFRSGEGVAVIAGVVGRCAEALAAAAFGVHAWPRVKMFGTER